MEGRTSDAWIVRLLRRSFRLWRVLRSMVQAKMTGRYNMTQNKHYGNCHVWTQVDSRTQDTTPCLACGDETEIAKKRVIIITQRSRTMVVSVYLGEMIQEDILPAVCPVTIRIDHGQVIRKVGRGDSDTMAAHLLGRDFVTALLDELARGETVAIEVGKTRGTIRLDGAAAAIADFRARCSADNQRGKEVL